MLLISTAKANKGIPVEYEFSSLINDLVLVSQRDSNLTPETRKFLKDLTQPVHLQVFVTPTCPYCPRAVILAHQFAMESPLVEAEMVEAMEFPELSERFEVSGAPQPTINMGAGTLVGAAPEQNLVAEIRKALEKTPTYSKDFRLMRSLDKIQEIRDDGPGSVIC